VNDHAAAANGSHVRSHVGPEKLAPNHEGDERLESTWDRMWSTMLTKVELEVLSKHAPHGTHARYNAHLLAVDEPCDRCREGEAKYRAELRARRDADPERIDRPRRDAVFTPQTAETEDEDDETEDDEEEYEPDEEEYEPDDAPRWHRARLPSPRAEESGSPFGPAWETMNGVFGWKGRPKPSRSPVSPASKQKRSTIPEDPRTRLRAITAELDSPKSRGSNVVALLVEATTYLTGGLTALRQYAEARGCDPEDARAAERAVLARQELERAGEHLPDRQDVHVANQRTL
jgi:hypothetical protein